MSKSQSKRSLGGFGRGAVIVSVGLLGLAFAGIGWITRPGQNQPTGVAQQAEDELIVYCASGLRTAVEPLLKQYEQEYGVTSVLRLGPSGALEVQAKMMGTGDLIIPAATDPFLERLREDGTVQEVLPVARLRLVVALAPGQETTPVNWDDLLADGFSLGLCNVESAAGERTRRSLIAAGRWEETNAAACVNLPAVTELAEAVRDGGRLDAGVIWNTTAAQYGLKAVTIAELSESMSTVGVGVLTSAREPSRARQLARYLTSVDKGQPFFRREHFECLPGECWQEVP